MSRAAKTVYTCSECGSQQPKWAGQCPDCGAWNTLQEGIAASAKTATGGRFAGYAGDAAVQVRTLSQVAAETTDRTATGMAELDRVLGGGLVQGSVVLIGGDPGIGKSTLLIQALASLSDRLPSLYVSGEESAEQISLRAQRLGLPAERLQLLTETCVERILQIAGQAGVGDKDGARILVLDSIQTFYSEQLQSAPGSVSQVRESAAQLVRFAKQTGTSLFLVGHVTKEGALAGPRVLEHMVDTVLYFEGEAGSQFRLVRAIKNRFGAVNELGVFAMTDKGLKEVSNPSAIFLSRHEQAVPGSAILVTREGTRPLLVEVQALVDQSPLANPRRVALGLEQNRLSMLLAVLHRHGGIGLFDQDVYLNVVGGVRISETAADLAVLLAVLSSFRDRPLPLGLAAFGEVGLAGEIRPVPNGQERLKEAVKHGFQRVILPKANAPKLAPDGVEVVAVTRLSEALDAL
jgi:DNA repair protein RadA/Sms